MSQYIRKTRARTCLFKERHKATENCLGTSLTSGGNDEAMAAILVFEVEQVGQVGDLNFRVHMRPVVEVFADGVFLVVVVQQRERER